MVAKKKQILNEDAGQGITTDAGRTIVAGAGAGSVGPMKMQVIQDFLGLMNGKDSDAMIDHFNKTMATFGPGNAQGAPDAAEKNKASIQTHNPNPVREALRADIDQLFSGTETINEDFKANATTLIEAAINSRVLLETERLKGEFEKDLEDESEEIYQFLTEKVNQYLEYVADKWLEDNAVAVVSTLRTEIAEEFIDGIKEVFVKANATIPEDKVDVVDALAAKAEELEAKLNEAIEANITLSESVQTYEKSKKIDTLVEGVSQLQAEKIRQLAEGVEFDGDVEDYDTKLSLIKETIVTAKKVPTKSNILTEEFDGEVAANNVMIIDQQMDRYVKAIARTTVKD